MMLHISTAGGKQFDVNVEGGGFTIAMLKQKVFELMSEDPEQAPVPCSWSQPQQAAAKDCEKSVLRWVFVMGICGISHL